MTEKFGPAVSDSSRQLVATQQIINHFSPAIRLGDNQYLELSLFDECLKLFQGQLATLIDGQVRQRCKVELVTLMMASFFELDSGTQVT